MDATWPRAVMPRIIWTEQKQRRRNERLSSQCAAGTHACTSVQRRQRATTANYQSPQTAPESVP
eukprot:7068146-Alexandrium_andersonii.AAC.1